MPLNLAEYGRINTRWLAECEAALAAFRDGQGQASDIERQRNAVRAPDEKS